MSREGSSPNNSNEGIKQNTSTLNLKIISFNVEKYELSCVDNRCFDQIIFRGGKDWEI